MYCKNCGNKINEKEKFCKECGTEINKEGNNTIKKKEENKPIKKKGNSSLVIGIISLVTLFIPFVSFILSIIGLSLGVDHKRETGRKSGLILNIVSLILNIIKIILITILIIFIVNTEGGKIIDTINKEIIKEDVNTNDITGNRFKEQDGSIIQFNDDKTFKIYYKNESKEGTYEIHVGLGAVKYIIENLNEYDFYNDNKHNSNDNIGGLSDFYVITLKYKNSDKKEYLLGIYNDKKLEVYNPKDDKEYHYTKIDNDDINQV